MGGEQNHLPQIPGPLERANQSLSLRSGKLQRPCPAHEKAKLIRVTQTRKCQLEVFFCCIRNLLRARNCPVCNRKSSCLLTQQVLQEVQRWTFLEGFAWSKHATLCVMAQSSQTLIRHPKTHSVSPHASAQPYFGLQPLPLMTCRI